MTHKVSACSYDGRISFPSTELSLDETQALTHCLNRSGVLSRGLMTWLERCGYRPPRSYEVLASDKTGWRWSSDDSFPNYQAAKKVEDDDALKLLNTLRTNEITKVFIACGHYDLVTPCLKTERDTVLLRENHEHSVQMKSYDAGHMIYFTPEAGKQINRDIVEWLGLEEPAL